MSDPPHFTACFTPYLKMWTLSKVKNSSLRNTNTHNSQTYSNFETILIFYCTSCCKGNKQSKETGRERAPGGKWGKWVSVFILPPSVPQGHTNRHRLSPKSANRCWSSLSLSIVAKRLNRPPLVLFALSPHPFILLLFRSFLCLHLNRFNTQNMKKKKARTCSQNRYVKVWMRPFLGVLYNGTVKVL